MPYRIIKKVRQATIPSYHRLDYASNFSVELDDDVTWKNYPLPDEDSFHPNIHVHGEASQLLDGDGKQIRLIKRDYDFDPVCAKFRWQWLGFRFGRTKEKRFLHLPRDLFLDFGIEESMAIDLFLNEIIIEQQDKPIVVPIYKEVLRLGPMDVVPRDDKGVPIPSSRLFTTMEFDDDYYSNLVIEINKAYGFGLYVSTLVLTRKLFENLLIDLLRTRYGMKKIDMFYEEDRGMHKNLSTLIDNLRDNVADFKMIDPHAFDEEFFKFLDELKDRANASAHSLVIQSNPNLIDSWKPSINQYGKLISSITQKIKEMPSA